MLRYPTGGQFFWSVYLKPGSSPGSGNGYWLNFGSGWCHLAHDNLTPVREWFGANIASEHRREPWQEAA